MGEWDLTYEGYDSAEQGLREALCTLANGYLGTRGAMAETSADGTHYPGTYVAGLFNRLDTEIDGHMVENEDMVNVPNWLPLTFRIDDGPWFSVDDVELLEHRVTLELRRGVLVRQLRFRDTNGRETAVAQRRIVHMGCKHLAAIEMSVRAENWSGTLTVRSALDGGVRNTGVHRYRDLANHHLDVVDAGSAGDDDELLMLRVRTNQSHVDIVSVARLDVWVDDEPVVVDRANGVDGSVVAQQVSVELGEASTCRVEKVVALYTSRDTAISEPGIAAIAEVSGAGPFTAMLESHVLRWDTLWKRFAIEIEGMDDAAHLLNVHLFHLLQVAAHTTHDLDVGIPARGLHGEAYRGHIFWDELFIFPLLNYRVPGIARDLLRYRHRRLPAARRAASEAGYRGAMFPWQSGSNGREESQVRHLNPESGRWLPDTSYRQRHIGSAIAHNVWEHVEVTGDVDFLAERGSEVFIEVARFWASIATYDEIDDRYDIHGVVGPDEFHDQDPNWDGPGLRNNAYTNVTAAWVLHQAEPMLDRLASVERAEVMDRLEVRREELEQWDHVSRRLRVPFHDDGIISQFEGYEVLDELDWDGLRERHGDIHRLDRLLEADGDDVNRYKASKQADVLMLPYLFSIEQLDGLFRRMHYPFDVEVLRRNIAYYMERTSHGSTLSRAVHSWVTARVDRAGSVDLLREALRSDVYDTQGGTTSEGVHLGAMAGTVDLVERGYSGMEVCDGLLRFKPRLPEGIDRVQFRIRYRRRWLTVSLSDACVVLRSDVTDEPPVQVGHRDEVVELGSGATVELRRDR